VLDMLGSSYVRSHWYVWWAGSPTTFRDMLMLSLCLRRVVAPYSGLILMGAPLALRRWMTMCPCADCDVRTWAEVSFFGMCMKQPGSVVVCCSGVVGRGILTYPGCPMWRMSLGGVVCLSVLGVIWVCCSRVMGIVEAGRSCGCCGRGGVWGSGFLVVGSGFLSAGGFGSLCSCAVAKGRSLSLGDTAEASTKKVKCS
jgi:hypothetical protein